MTAIIIAIILFAGLFIGLSLKQNTAGVYFKVRGRSYLAFFALLAILPALFAQVNANEVGIVYDPLNGGIQDQALNEGLHLKSPLQQVKTISTKLREESYTVTAQTGIIIRENSEGELEETGGGQWATYQVTIQYKVEVHNAHTFYRQFGGDIIPASTMEARLRESLQSTSVEQDIFSILKGGLNEVRNGTEIDLQESLQELGVTVEAFIILDVDAGDEIEQVVRDEATAAKQKEIASKEQESELIRQETKRLSAEIEALTVVIEADALAEAQKILNSVTASAIYTMYEGQFLDDLGDIDDTLKSEFELNGVGGFLTIQEISDIVIKQLYYDTWDGILPTVITDSDGSIIIQP